MIFRDRIREWLGIADIESKMDYIIRSQQTSDNIARQIEQAIALHNAALARIIAKLDPLYGIPEDDPRRKAASDEIGNTIIAKLRGEIEARKPFK